MIQPTPTPTAPPAPVPGGVRLAAIFCWIVGLLSAGVSLAMGIPSLSAGGSLLLVVANVTAGIMVCVAGFLVWKQRRLGVLLVVLGWAFPTVGALLTHQPTRAGPVLLLIAMLLLFANWKNLH